MTVKGRVLAPPTLRYGGDAQPTIVRQVFLFIFYFLNLTETREWPMEHVSTFCSNSRGNGAEFY